MSDKPYIPLSRLRQLRGQARRSWINNATSSDDIFRHYVDSEVAEMTIAALRARITELEGAIKWEPVEWEKPLNSHGDYIHSGTLFIRCTTFGEGIVHGYTFQEGECLMRRVTAATNE